MAFGTYKPCHGCGSTGWKSVNTLCEPCQGLIRAGEAMKQEEEAKLEKGFVFRLSKEWPGIYSPGMDLGARRLLEKAFEELARAVLKPLKSKKGPYSDGVIELPEHGPKVHYCSYERGATLWAGTKRAAKALTDLDRQIRVNLLLAHEDGKKEGSDLLMQLAKGEVTIRELTDAQIEAGRR